MPIEIPATGGGRIKFRPQGPGTPVVEYRDFWDEEHTAAGTFLTWVMGAVVDGNFFPFPEFVAGPFLGHEALAAEWARTPGGKGAWYIGKRERKNYLANKFADITPDQWSDIYSINGKFVDIAGENKVIEACHKWEPDPTDAQPLCVIRYRPDPLAPLPQTDWDYT